MSEMSEANHRSLCQSCSIGHRMLWQTARGTDMRYSGFRVIREALTGHKGWQPAWRDPAPQASYDYVIVDLPPLAPIVDVRATTPLVDCFVLVVEWGRTKIDVVQHALRTAPNVSEAILGAVLNKTDMSILNRYDSYNSDYYNPEHYGRYGYVDRDK